jgi:hypothetical protein
MIAARGLLEQDISPDLQESKSEPLERFATERPAATVPSTPHASTKPPRAATGRMAAAKTASFVTRRKVRRSATSQVENVIMIRLLAVWLRPGSTHHHRDESQKPKDNP